MFDVMKKAKALEAVANEAKEIIAIAMSVDTDGKNGPDIPQLLNELKDLPELIQKEGSEVADEVDEARKAIGDKLRSIATLSGEVVEEIQEQASGHIKKMQEQFAKLQ